MFVVSNPKCTKITFSLLQQRCELHLPDIRRSSCGEGDVGRLCSLVVRAVDLQSKDLGSNPSAVESVFFSTDRFKLFSGCLVVLRGKNCKKTYTFQKLRANFTLALHT